MRFSKGVSHAVTMLLVLWAAAVVPASAADDAQGFRVLPPGTLTTISPDDSTNALTDRIDVPSMFRRVAVKDWKPETSPADRTLRGQFAGPGGDVSPGQAVERDVWCLEFAFMPPRLIDVDVPTEGLTMERRRLWYLVYRVRNVGGWRLEVDPADASKRTPKRVEMPVRFLPLLVLETHQRITESEGLAAYRGYADRAVPTAPAAIERRERLGRPLLDSTAMAASELEPGEERWGVATWEHVHPDIRFFSIVVTGLSNRFRFRPPEEGREEGTITLESLRLDFWHRGDEADPAVAEVAIGHEGLFERSTLGTSLLEAVNRTTVSRARPAEGLEALGLTWDGILEPGLSPDDALDRKMPASLEPLAKVIEAIAAIDTPASRERAIRDIFGEAGADTIATVVRAVAAPADAARSDLRQKALAAVGAGPEAFDGDPLIALGRLIRGLERIRQTDERDAVEAAIFGDDVGRFRLLGRWLAAARAVAVLDGLGIDRTVLSTLGPRPAFDRVWKEIEAARNAEGVLLDADGRDRLAAGLFGAEGPMLLADAVARHPGIDHEWFFRYEFED